MIGETSVLLEIQYANTITRYAFALVIWNMSAAHVMTSLEMMKIDDYPIVETSDIDGDSTKHIT